MSLLVCTVRSTLPPFLSPRFSPPPSSRRGPPPWVRHLKGQREALEKKQQEEQDLADYINSLEAKRTYFPHVIEALHNIDHNQVPMELIVELIKVIYRSEEPGAILVFMPGWDTISKLHDMLKADPVFRSRHLIIPLHSLMPTSYQQSVIFYIIIIYLHLQCTCTSTCTW